MKVGDIGVLQNLGDKYRHYNGMPVEIVSLVKKGEYYETDVNGIREVVTFSRDGYQVSLVYGNYLVIETHQIRPLDDPDKQLINENQKEVVV